MAQSFFPITTVEITPSGTGWETVDLSSYIPEGSTGVVLHFVNASASNYQVGARKPAATLPNAQYLSAGHHTWCMAGVNSSRQVSIYVGNITDIDVYLVAYTKNGVTFLDDGVNVSPTTTGSWQEIDLSSYCPTGTLGVIFMIRSASSTKYAFGLRKKGSTDARLNKVRNFFLMGFLVGIDSARKVECYIENSTIAVYLVGYVTDGATFLTNATDLSLGSSGSWLDLDQLPEGAVLGFLEVVNQYEIAGYNFGLRKNGDSEDIYQECECRAFGIIPCDASRLIEGKIASGTIDFFLTGYATGVAAGKPRRGAWLLLEL